MTVVGDPLKTPYPSVAPAGMLAVVSEEHTAKACSPIVVTESETTNDVNEEHFVKA